MSKKLPPIIGEKMRIEPGEGTSPHFTFFLHSHFLIQIFISFIVISDIQLTPLLINTMNFVQRGRFQNFYEFYFNTIPKRDKTQLRFKKFESEQTH